MIMTDDVRARVEIEKTELETRITALEKFMCGGSAWDNLDPRQRTLLYVQIDIMRAYYTILDNRLCMR